MVASCMAVGSKLVWVMLCYRHILTINVDMCCSVLLKVKYHVDEYFRAKVGSILYDQRFSFNYWDKYCSEAAPTP